MNIRAEQPEDLAAIRNVNIVAFGRESEANLVDQLRGVTSTLSFVAVDSKQVVGHIFFSPVTITGQFTDHLLMLGLAPIAVLPNYQRQGIGSSLIQYGLAACKGLGCKAVVVLGSPAYYSRFGFITATAKRLKCEYNVPDEAFMVLELERGSLANYAGLVQYRSEFNSLEA